MDRSEWVEIIEEQLRRATIEQLRLVLIMVMNMIR